ncbi:hypothetical protein [Belnapia rosea]|uniref:hypothetical protein n=1 Tax=Belnapia rosea TaxID=938405 RepID=UPI00115FF421|nr:hypothetical protein [Belnapia rosea]
MDPPHRPASARDGDLATGQKSLERSHGQFGAVPLHAAMADWHGVARVLRLLEASWLSYTDCEPSSASFSVGCEGSSLRGQAERFASLKATLLSRQRSRDGK